MEQFSRFTTVALLARKSDAAAADRQDHQGDADGHASDAGHAAQRRRHGVQVLRTLHVPLRSRNDAHHHARLHVPAQRDRGAQASDAGGLRPCHAAHANNAAPYLWGEALLTAADVHNAVGQPSIKGLQPAVVLFKERAAIFAPTPKSLRVWGCDAWIHLSKPQASKLDARHARPGILFGYAVQQSQSYRVLDAQTLKVVNVRDVVFREESFANITAFPPLSRYSASLRLSNVEAEQQTEPLDAPAPVPPADADDAPPPLLWAPLPLPPAVPPSQQTVPARRVDDAAFDSALDPAFVPSVSERALTHREPVRRSTRESRTVPRFGMADYTSADLETESVRHAFGDNTYLSSVLTLPISHSLGLAAAVAGESDPVQTFQDAMASPDVQKWLEAIRSELKAMEDNKVWTVVPRPPGVTVLKTRWVCKLKLDENNKPLRYKGRLVVKGFSQIPGVHFSETFAPVVAMKNLKLALSIAAHYDLELLQMDFDTAFLNAKLTETIYMELPEGHPQRGNPQSGVPPAPCSLRAQAGTARVESRARRCAHRHRLPLSP